MEGEKILPINEQLQANLNRFRQANIGIDVRIAAGKRKFSAHRWVLAATSKMFERMFTTDMKEKDQEEITVDESVLDANTFELILEFIYTSKLQVNQDNAMALDRAADYLDIKQIKFKTAKKLYASFFLKFRHKMEKEKILSINQQLQVNLNHFRLTNIGLDVTIVVGQQKFSAHRSILAAASNMFERMFITDMHGNDQEKITLDESVLDAGTFELVLEFIYTGELDINENNAMALARAAVYLEIEQIRFEAETFLEKQISSVNLIDSLFLAKKYSLKNLHKVCCEYLTITRHSNSITETKRFLDLNYDDLLSFIDILQKLGLKVFLLKVFMVWINSFPGTREEYLFEFLNNYPLESLPLKFLEHLNGSEAIIGQSSRCSRLLSNTIARLSKEFLSTEIEETVYMVNMNDEKGKLRILRLDTQKREWINLKASTFLKCLFRSAVIDSKIFIYGYSNHENIIQQKLEVFDRDDCEEVQEFKVFDTVFQKWEILKSKSNRILPGVAALEGKLYFAGGSIGEEICSSMERYCVITDSWQEMARMQESRKKFALIELSGKLYAIGGSSLNRSVERYDPLLNKWTMVAPTNNLYLDAQATVYKGKIFIVGEGTSEVYDPINNKWTMLYNELQQGFLKYPIHLMVFEDKLFALLFRSFGICCSQECTAKCCGVQIFNDEANVWSPVEKMPKILEFEKSHIAIVHH